ncbi:MAG: methionyl-tRNA formyltransferase [Ruminococcaceae bacterium]|nr:methionyl-tRNA formyltransferase [Oscillospiraceae bacterium]
MRVVYFGTPDIATLPLIEIAKHHDVAGVYCQPDRKTGRKGIITPPEVKVAAESLGLPVFQPEKIRNEDFLSELKALSADVAVVMAYGKIIPKEALAVPRYGFINIHASLLPRWRGAAPVQYALMHGDKKTGVTIMQMDEGIDTGDIISSEEIEIAAEDDAKSLFSAVSSLGAKLVIETLRDIEEKGVSATLQNEESASYAGLIKREMGLFSFFDSTGEILGKVKGLCIWPVAYFKREGSDIKVHKAAASNLSGKPGEVLSVNPLIIGTKDGSLEIVKIQQSGKRAMSGEEFSLGRRFKTGDFIDEIYGSANLKEEK